ncbi:MAG: DUF1501 domain-containing protein [Planctomycetes bacterium]|nr:DUF1501 domain-containing protein [Planctomycetota bacterium]
MNLWTRRRLLQVGGIGALGLGLPELLNARAAVPGAVRRGPERSCIFIVQYGGASHHDSWDLKPDAPQDIRGPYKPITTNVPGVRIGELLPRLARLADRCCLVRSMTHGNGGHDGGMHICMTGHSLPKENTPYFGSVMAKLRPATRNVPSYVWVQNLAGDVQPRYLNGGFLGAAYAPLRVGNDLDNPSVPNFRVGAFDPPRDVPLPRLHARQALLGRVEPGTSPMLRARPADALRRFQERAVELLTGPEARRAFDLDREPASVRDRYGRHPLGQNLLMARRLIEAGVRLVSVTAWCGTPPGERFRNVQTWDMHGDGAGLGSIFGTGAYGLGWALPRVDEAVSALLLDLEQRGLLASTLVVMVGEFGRSPKIVRAGRDHWPSVYSALLAGAGVRGGTVHGASDKIGGYVRDNPVSPEDFGATLFQALGVPPETRLGADGFTHPVSTGRPVPGLFG